MNNIDDIIVLKQVKDDLKKGRDFYELNNAGIGDYFIDSIISDIMSLKLYAGIHNKHFGLYRMLSKRFPYAIYYDIKNTTAIIVAVLDMRRNSDQIQENIKERY